MGSVLAVLRWLPSPLAKLGRFQLMNCSSETEGLKTESWGLLEDCGKYSVASGADMYCSNASWAFLDSCKPPFSCEAASVTHQSTLQTESTEDVAQTLHDD